MSHPSARIMEIPAARPRPRPQNPSISGAESEALRTSVWETVLQLGIGVNPTVANWMFDNKLAEEDEVRTIFCCQSWLPCSFFSLILESLLNVMCHVC